MRSQAREAVFKLIFSQLFNPNDEGLFTVLCKELNENDSKFAKDLLEAVKCGEEKYLSEVERLAIGYKLNRLHLADKCALVIGMAELNRFKETPVAVVINETVNLVAKYSTENSTDFVNGILAEYVRENKNG
ncbi:MAG: transcription antitermination protein NusB [Clostridiales bacterium]|nr:transcription antitermination protein NusB [Clostridiales bacterium]